MQNDETSAICTLCKCELSKNSHYFPSSHNIELIGIMGQTVDI